jgi:dihydropyrimidine dehydrogenase (NAD+) subunit PreT
MSWTILIGLLLVLGFLSAVASLRRAELGSMERAVTDRDRAVQAGSREAQLQHPVVDLTRCMGCATCVAVCPETGVLEIVHGQATIVNGAGCMGISACERECPVGAITVTLANAETRTDIPAIEASFEAVGAPGVFLAGEVTAQALIRTAVLHGTAVAAEVGERVRALNGSAHTEALDLAIIGAGPAGLACALEATRQGLRFAVIDRADDWGGTVAKYPRNKLVLTQPVDLPIYGRIRKTTLTKEELITLWTDIAADQQLPFIGGKTLDALDRDEKGRLVVRCGNEQLVANNVCLAIGRRGTPRMLDVPGEELPKVAHSLIDATSFSERRILVVGGGDSAIETALALASHGDNQVTVSYRKPSFFRLRARNAQKLEEAVAAGRIELCMESEVTAIHPDRVDLQVNGSGQALSIANDNVFVMIGGLAPFATLEAAGVSFDPKLRPAPRELETTGTDLTRALWAATACAFGVLLFILWHHEYYLSQPAARATHVDHALLRPSSGLGLIFGIGALVLVATNLAYLLRRSPRFKLSFGTLQNWMTVHVATGVTAVLLAFLHAALVPRETPGGRAAWLLVGLLITGAIGRYFYAWVPRAANGRELELDEIRAKAHALPQGWGKSGRDFGDTARSQVLNLIRERQWNSSFFGRVLALCGADRLKRRTLTALQLRGVREGVPQADIDRTLALVRRAHEQALAAAHLEDLRAVANTWRYLHRWGAVLMVVLILIHVVHALIYGDYFSGGAA